MILQYELKSDWNTPFSLIGCNGAANDNLYSQFACLKKDWESIWKNYWMQRFNDPRKYWETENFERLKSRIEKHGRLIEITFKNGDIFEKNDADCWIPNDCFINAPRGKNNV